MDYIIPSDSSATIDEDTRSRHTYIVGRTGSGKSVLIQDMVAQIIEAGEGVCLIDFHQDTVRAIADTVPEEHINRVIYFDPTDPTHVCTLDLLAHDNPLDRTAITSRIISIFKSLWWDAWGPSTNYILYNTLRLLLETPGTTMVDIPKVLIDTRFRNRLIRNCKDEHITAFWRDEFAGWPEKFRKERIAPLQNKATVFTNPILAPILGRTATLNIREIIDQKKVLLCDFSKARMGDDNAQVLASLLINLYYQAGLSRGDTPPEQRHLYDLIIDEFQNAPIDTLDTVFSEMRKYKIALTVAHQHSEQVPKKLLSAALANAATKIIFKVNAIDGKLLGPDMGLGEGLVGAIGKYQARISIDGGKANLHQLRHVKRKGGKLKKVIDRTHARYARPRIESTTP